MLKFSANIEMLSPPVDFYERFGIARKSGFNCVEFWSWEGKDLSRIASSCAEHDLSISSLSGDGKEFSLCDDRHRKHYLDYACTSLEVAKTLGATCIVIHSNALDAHGLVVDAYEDIPSVRLYMNMVKTLVELVPFAEKEGITCVLEPLNGLVDHKGNLLRTIKEAAEVVEVVDSPCIKVLYDMYHMQIESGNLISVFEKYHRLIGHIHVADNPGRHDPGTGEINYKRIFQHLDALEYTGFVAFELSPEDTYEKAVAAIMQLRTFSS